MGRDDENFLPSIVRNSLETTSVGRFSTPNSPVTRPCRPAGVASSSAGQISEWNTTLSLPMK